MDMDTLTQINQLIAEHGNTVEGLHELDSGATINMMQIGGASVSTVGWTYPPPMVTSIRQILQDRLVKIEEDLKTLGFTGNLETEAE